MVLIECEIEQRLTVKNVIQSRKIVLQSVARYTPVGLIDKNKDTSDKHENRWEVDEKPPNYPTQSEEKHERSEIDFMILQGSCFPHNFPRNNFSCQCQE